MVVHAYYPLGETRVQREALALRDRGWDVHVISLRAPGEAAKDEHEGITITRLSVGRNRDRGFAGQLLEYLNFFVRAAIALGSRHLRRRFDSVQVHNLPDFLVFAAVVPKLTGTPVVLDIHDLMPEFFGAKTESSLDAPLVRVVRLQERLACAFADRVITVTDGWRQTLIERGVAEHKISVVMNVADDRVFGPAAGSIGDRPDGDRFELIYHGTFTHRYGVDLIVTAVDLLRHELPTVHATLLGDGDGRDELVDLVNRLGLEDRISISDGMVSVSDLPPAIRGADVGLVPNRSNVFTDGILPTKLLEYVAMGLPALVARTPGVEAYFTDDQVEYFQPGDAEDLADRIRDLHADASRRAALADKASSFNQEHAWADIAESYAEMMSEAAGAVR